jgi:hypothetical protein
MAYQVRCGPGDGGNLRTSCPVTNRRIHHKDDHPYRWAASLSLAISSPSDAPDVVVPQLLERGEVIVVQQPGMGLAGPTTNPTRDTILPPDRDGPRRLASLPPSHRTVSFARAPKCTVMPRSALSTESSVFG